MDEVDADVMGSAASGSRALGEVLAFTLTIDGDGAPLLKLDGELDMSNAGRVDAAVSEVIAGSPDRLVVDVKNLQFADSSAIALFVRWANLVPQVEIREPSDSLRRLLTRMGLSRRLKVRP